MGSEFEESYEDAERIRGAMFTSAISELNLRPPVVVDVGTSVVDAVAAMNEHHIGCVLVQSGGKLVGIFTERDGLTRVAFREGNRTMKVGDVMTKSPETLEA